MKKSVQFSSDTIFVERIYKDKTCVCYRCSNCNYGQKGLCGSQSSVQCRNCKDNLCTGCVIDNICHACHIVERLNSLFITINDKTNTKKCVLT